MSGILETNLDARHHFHPLPVFHRHKLFQAGFDIGNAIQRFDSIFTIQVATNVLVFGILFADESGVAQHDVGEVHRGRMCDNLAAKSPAIQQGDATGMVNMCMCQHHRIDLAGVERERCEILALLARTALHQSAVDQDAMRTHFKQMTGTGDLPCCAMKYQFHLRPPGKLLP